MLIRADALRIPLADTTVNCVVTSPPYWGLRDYGTPGQLGLEPAPEEYVANMVAVFREVRRVLRDDGTLWLNLGDSYSMSTRGKGGDGKQSTNLGTHHDRKWQVAPGLKPKDLVGIPWRVAFALQADGWWLRQDIVWAKPNPMPESVTDRCTKAHEYVFLLTKSARYYYDADAVAEPFADSRMGNPGGGGHYVKNAPYPNIRNRDQFQSGLQRGAWNEFGDRIARNRRSVWTIPTQPYPEAHFATFPEKLPELCIRAGCPVGGVVLDPFVGSGTSVRVATRLNRRGVGLDLAYQHLAAKRTTNVQRELLWAGGVS